MRALLLILLGALLVTGAEGHYYYRRHVTVNHLKQTCSSRGWPRCMSCNGECVYGRTFNCERSACASNPCGRDEMCVENNCGRCSACCVKRPYCSSTPKRCPCGTKIYRDAANNCDFPKCPPMTCPADVRQCPDGSLAPRDPERGCAYGRCDCLLPQGWTMVGNNAEACRGNRYTCGRGAEPWCDSHCGCGCKPGGGCPGGLKKCADGSTVARDPQLGCQFPKCKCPPEGWTVVGRSPWTCRRIRFTCKPGTKHWCDSECGCGCKPVVCPVDEKTCPDGSVVPRDPTKKCEFARKCECTPGNWTVVPGGPDACKTTQPTCGPGFEPWNNTDCGCGCKPLPVCPEDVKTCPDGSTIRRDRRNKCRFTQTCECTPGNWTVAPGGPAACRTTLPTCGPGFQPWNNTDCGCGCRPLPAPPVPVCPEGVKTCPDGTTVRRDPADNCTFPACPCPPAGWTLTGYPAACATTPPTCGTGYLPWSHTDCGCGCKPLPVCSNEVKTCPDGTTVSRDPMADCEFPECRCPPAANWTLVADPDTCDKISYPCGPGFEPWSHTECGCGCRPLPVPPVVCPEGVRTCPDGTTVRRDPANNCTFPECQCPPAGWTLTGNPTACAGGSPPTCGAGLQPWSHPDCGCGCRPAPPAPPVCDDDVKTCIDGTTVVRDPANNCTFPECQCPPANWTLIGNPTTCPLINYLCNASSEFPETCRKILYNCPPGFEPWGGPESDAETATETEFVFECGCGCRPSPQPEPVPEPRPRPPVVPGPPTEPVPEPVVPRPPTEPVPEPVVPRPVPEPVVPRPPTEPVPEPVVPRPVPEPVDCPEGVMTCADGTVVRRDPANGCAYPECPTTATGPL